MEFSFPLHWRVQVQHEKLHIWDTFFPICLLISLLFSLQKSLSDVKLWVYGFENK